ncbi:MAG: hypothetical protein RLZZ618_11 [Pseudomonadota bacterium]|jgi:hypothetical protein
MFKLLQLFKRNTRRSADPIATATAFAHDMRRQGFALDLSMESLKGEVDRLLRSEHLCHPEDRTQWTTEARLGAYVGEVLRRAFDGTWEGDYRDDHAGVNCYTSFVVFGRYRYNPAMALGYRISNGEASMGRFSDHIERVLPSIKARRGMDEPTSKA